MSYVRKRLLMLSLLAVLTCGARAQGVPFFFPSLPVVYADPGFGIGYRTAGDGVEESHYGAYGKGRYGRVHGAFAYEYTAATTGTCRHHSSGRTSGPVAVTVCR